LTYGISAAQSHFGPMHPGALHGVHPGQYASDYNPAYTSGYGIPPSGPQTWQMGTISMHTPTNELQQFNLSGRMTLPAASVNGNLQPRGDSGTQDCQTYPDVRPPTGEQAHGNAPGKATANEVQKVDLVQRSAARYQESAIDHESPSTDDDTSTLSPSSFHIQQFNVPGCNDITGTCCCGDGCECPGCQTHTGHGKEVENESSASSVTPTNQLPEQDLNGFSIDDFHALPADVFPSSGAG